MTGELDRATVPAFERAVAELDSPGNLVLDVHDLEFLDAGGLRSIIGISRAAGEAGRSVTIANASSSLRRLFTLTGLERSVTLVTD